MAMLPDLQSTLLCDDVRQERTGKFILIGLFDSLGSPTFPFRHPRMFLVTRWCSGEGQFEQHTKVLRPDMSTIVAGITQISTDRNDVDLEVTHAAT